MSRTPRARGAALGAALLLPLLGACDRPPSPDEGSSGPPDLPFDTARVWLHTGDGDSVELRVEVARTEAQRGLGLMYREALDSASGMLFLWDSVRGGEEGFWMWRTRIPLDAAYVGAEDAIVAILTMEPCPSPNPEFCDPYPPGVPYASALEVNRDWLRRHGVEVGDRITVDWGPPTPTGSSR